MYNIQHTISQQYIITSKNKNTSSTSIKTIKHLQTNNTTTTTLANIKFLKV